MLGIGFSGGLQEFGKLLPHGVAQCFDLLRTNKLEPITRAEHNSGEGGIHSAHGVIDILRGGQIPIGGVNHGGRAGVAVAIVCDVLDDGLPQVKTILVGEGLVQIILESRENVNSEIGEPPFDDGAAPLSPIFWFGFFQFSEAERHGVIFVQAVAAMGGLLPRLHRVTQRGQDRVHKTPLCRIDCSRVIGDAPARQRFGPVNPRLRSVLYSVALKIDRGPSGFAGYGDVSIYIRPFGRYINCIDCRRIASFSGIV